MTPTGRRESVIGGREQPRAAAIPAADAIPQEVDALDPNRSLTAIALVGDSQPKTAHAREIEVTLIEPGWSKMCLLGGKVTRLYADETLLSSAAYKFEGVPAFLNHLGASDWTRGSRDVRDLVGVYHDPHYVA